MSSEKEFHEINQELRIYKPILSNVSQTILVEDISKYPIFVMSSTDIEIGIPVLSEDTSYSINIKASTLEELHAKKIIPLNKIDDFRKIYKDPKEWFCILYITPETQQFLFIPQD